MYKCKYISVSIYPYKNEYRCSIYLYKNDIWICSCISPIFLTADLPHLNT